MALRSDANYQEKFSLALEDRSAGYIDLVSNSNALLTVMKQKGMWKPFSGPKIRERLLFAETGSYIRYSGFDFLNPVPKELINDADFEPKMAAVSITIANEEILKTDGENQLMDLLQVHMEAAEQELQDRFVEDLHGDGTAADGNQIGGLQLAIPTDPTAGTYGGISRADHALWRTTAIDAHTADATIGTQVSSTTVRQWYEKACIERSRGRKGPDLLLASQEHYSAFSAALEAIQRVTDGGGLGKLGFPTLRFYGAGKSMDVVLEGGIGTAMPSNVTYFIDTDGICFRYHPKRNFSKIGGKQMPINQDAMVQHIGFMGELTLKNPLHMVKLLDSTPGS